MSQDQNAWQSHNIKTDNSSFERVKQFKYLGATLTNQNSIQEKTKNRLKSGNACYHSVQNTVFQFAIQKYKDYDTQNYNLACYFVWVCNMVAHIVEKT
jgi:hypothetical protein